MAALGGGGGGSTPYSQFDPARDPVLCSPYDPPHLHWELDNTGQAKRNEPPKEGRRDPMRIGVTRDHKAGKQQALTLQDRKTNELVKKIRQDVGNWRADGYRGVTATTLRLLHHWTDPPAMKLRPFFAQVEAIETLIWLREVATRQTTARRELQEAARHHNDGIVRLCSKMATGTGKTTVMGMAIAWQTLNAARSTRTRNVMHTDRFVVFAPGHTVRERLGVLHPSASDNVYDEMGLVPHDLRELLNRAKVKVVNFQAFTQRELIEDSSARKLLGKGNREDIESWEAAVRRVLAGVLDGDRTPVNLVIECKGAWDDKADQARKWTQEHWIPCLAGTTELPDTLRRWSYGVIDDPSSVRHQLGQAITAAQEGR